MKYMYCCKFKKSNRYYMPYSFRWIKKVPDVHGIDKNFEIALCMYKEGKKQKGGCKVVSQNVISHIAS